LNPLENLETNKIKKQFFVVAVSLIHFRGKDLNIPMARGSSGEYASLIKSWLKNIMYGKETHEWGVVVDEVEA